MLVRTYGYIRRFSGEFQSDINRRVITKHFSSRAVFYLAPLIGKSSKPGQCCRVEIGMIESKAIFAVR